MRKIKIAHIGLNTNSHSVDVYKTLLRHSDIFDVVGYALPSGEKERLAHKIPQLAVRPELSLEQILNDPTIEAVTVETDEIYTTKYAIMAAEHGKHIHMEKPGGREIEDFEKLISIVKKTGKIFHTGYMYRYNPLVQQLMKRIKAGELGEIINVEAQMNCYHPPEVRAWLGELPGGMMFFLGCHLVDLVMQIKGVPDNIVPFNRASGLDGVDTIDCGMAVLEYKDGVSFVKTTAIERGGFQRRQLVVTGTKGTVEIKPLERAVDGGQISKQVYYDSENWHVNGEETVSEVHGRYDSLMTAFAAMVRGEMTNPWSPDYELELYKNVLKCCAVNN